MESHFQIQHEILAQFFLNQNVNIFLLDMIGLSRSSHWRRHQDDAIPPHKQHGDRPLGGPVHFFVSFLVDLHHSHSLLHLSEYHIEMLIVSVKTTLELPLVPHFDVNPLVQRKANQIERLLHRNTHGNIAVVVRHHKIFTYNLDFF